MKYKKLAAIIIPASVAVLVAGFFLISAMSDEPTKKTVSTQAATTKSVSEVDTIDEEAQSLEATGSVAANIQPESNPAPAPTPPPPSEPALYGSYDANPALQTVYNKEKVMELSGIAPADFRTASEYIARDSGWKFSTDGKITLCKINMAQAAADWKTNPVSQLKLCTAYITASAGGWPQALARIKY